MLRGIDNDLARPLFLPRLNADGTNQTHITNDTFGSDYQPDW